MGASGYSVCEGYQMTVIAYSRKHRILAADSRCSDEWDMHLTNARKIYRLKNGALVGTAGDDDCRELLVLLSKATPRKMPGKQQLADTKTSFLGIMVFPKGQVFRVNIDFNERTSDGSEWEAQVCEITDEVIAVGHGQQFAYGILDAGGTPQDAVRGACKRDLSCALPVQWEPLDIKKSK
jgi:hypothetical protein